MNIKQQISIGRNGQKTGYSPNAQVPDFRQLFLPILDEVQGEQTATIDIRAIVAERFGIDRKGWGKSFPAWSKNSYTTNFDLALNCLSKCGFLQRSTIPNPKKLGKRIEVLSITANGAAAREARTSPELDEKHRNLNLAFEPMRNASRVGSKLSGVGRNQVPRPTAIRPRANVLGAEGAIIENIPTLELEKLFNLWKENVRRLGDPSQNFKHAAAARIIKAVEKEWDRRLPFIRLNPDSFKWPSTDVTGGGSGFDIGNAPDLGMLGYLEYRVGRTQGQSMGVRRSILDRVVEGTLPLFGGLDYYDEWGTPSSATRLQKLAETIAAFARNAKRRNSNKLKDAVTDWEADLDYLYQTYYLSRYAFGWPTV